MPLPRLLFAKEKTAAASPDCVINDLKLDLILPPEVTELLLLAPEKETLLARREMFSLLLADSDSLAKMKALAEKMAAAEELYKALTGAVSEKTAAFVMPHLTVKLSELCELAADMKGYGMLFDRFVQVFAELRGKNGFDEALAEAKRLTEVLKNASAFVIRTDGENATVTASAEGGMADALKACAEELQIPITLRPVTSMILQKGIAEAVGKVFPEVFEQAYEFLSNSRTLVTGEIFEYIPELRCIIGILEFTEKAVNAGIPYCFPELCEEKKIAFRNVYDVTLLKKEGTVIVPNDVGFSEKEPFFYVTGANGGGKTTYVRTVGGSILMFLAGAPVFCEGGEASLLSAVYTHFPRDERFEGTGRFLDEKRRVDAILEAQNGSSVILLNETFSTTGEDKAREQTDILAKQLYGSGNFGLYITHQHDVTENEIPFLGVTVDESDSNRRTYKIEKRRLPPRSFARDILEKYGLDKASLEKRFGREVL